MRSEKRKGMTLSGWVSLVTLVLIGMLVVATGRAPADEDTANTLVAQGRAYLAQQDIVNANSCFQTAVLEDATNQNANIFYAVTRLLVLVYDPEFQHMLDQSGVSPLGRNIYDWTADWTRDADGGLVLPEGTPAGDEVTALFVNLVVPEIEGALANLAVVDPSFNIMLEPAEILSGEQVEVDYGDVCLYRSVLYGAKSMIMITDSYNLNVEPAVLLEKIKAGIFSINTDLFVAYSDFLKVKTPDQLAPAKEAIDNSIDSYFVASAVIRGEVDDQLNDFVAFDADSLLDEEEFRNTLADLQSSLTGPAMVGGGEEDDPLPLDLSRFFDDPFHLRDMLPIFDAENNLLLCSLPDPTLNGVLPEFTNDTWNNMLQLPIAVNGTVICPEWTGGPIIIEGYSDAWFLPWDLVNSTTIAEPGYYSVNFAADSDIWLFAYWDRDNNGYFSTGDVAASMDMYNPVHVLSESCSYADFLPFILSTECVGDMDGDNDKDGSDLAAIAASFGASACVGDCSGDFNGDLQVDGRDLFIMGVSMLQPVCEVGLSL
ncbi:MAG: hypothetical protein KKC76_18630 [Proteobacteria bacterium]|nr:hypothetical protein [Pseudomonadota bacterium]MBU4295225.1 hypothetical protein [Pseudomonadota bacterium]MCG2750159.1 hypothetical protein [Desulfobulbaceae bacterium]